MTKASSQRAKLSRAAKSKPRRTRSPTSRTAKSNSKSNSKSERTPATASRKAKPNNLRRAKNGVVYLSGGNPQIAKAEGNAPVNAYIAALPAWKRDIAKRLDKLITRTVPKVRKAVKWNSPFYGIEGRGWFLQVHVFTNYVKVAFFRGASLRPIPPGASKHKAVRYVDLREGELDEAQLAKWVRQAAALPGWMSGQS
ncbi:MAG: DUF1801 domain-containing protein [Kofleriaceae bacterium]